MHLLSTQASVRFSHPELKASVEERASMALYPNVGPNEDT